MIKLGSKVKDPVTGYEGIAVARTEFLYGCARIGVQAKKSKDGKVPDWQYFDEPQLEGLPPNLKSVRTRGGPKPDTVRNTDFLHED